MNAEKQQNTEVKNKFESQLNQFQSGIKALENLSTQGFIKVSKLPFEARVIYDKYKDNSSDPNDFTDTDPSVVKEEMQKRLKEMQVFMEALDSLLKDVQAKKEKPLDDKRFKLGNAIGSLLHWNDRSSTAGSGNIERQHSMATLTGASDEVFQELERQKLSFVTEQTEEVNRQRELLARMIPNPRTASAADLRKVSFVRSLMDQKDALMTSLRSGEAQRQNQYQHSVEAVEVAENALKQLFDQQEKLEKEEKLLKDAEAELKIVPSGETEDERNRREKALEDKINEISTIKNKLTDLGKQIKGASKTVQFVRTQHEEPQITAEYITAMDLATQEKQKQIDNINAQINEELREKTWQGETWSSVKEGMGKTWGFCENILGPKILKPGISAGWEASKEFVSSDVVKEGARGVGRGIGKVAKWGTSPIWGMGLAIGALGKGTFKTAEFAGRSAVNVGALAVNTVGLIPKIPLALLDGVAGLFGKDTKMRDAVPTVKGVDWLPSWGSKTKEKAANNVNFKEEEEKAS